MSRKLVSATLAILALSMCSRPSPVGVTSVGGRVYGFFSCTPVQGAKVKVGNKAPVETDANGVFPVVSDVQVPYDIVTLSPGYAAGDPAASINVYEGLTRPDPIVRIDDLNGSGPNWNQSITVSGNLLGAIMASNALVRLSAPDLDWGCTVDLTAVPPNYSCSSVGWYGTSAVTGKLRALSWNVDGSGAPTDYVGFVEKDVSFTSGAIVSGFDLTLSTVGGKATVSGTISAPEGFAINYETAEVDFANPVARFLVAADTSGSSSFSHIIPTIAGAQVAMTAAAYAGASSIIARTVVPAAAATGIVVDLPAPPSLTEPADGATDIGPGSVLRWTAVPGASYLVFVTPVSGGPSLFAVTSRSEFRIPDLSGMGAGLQAGLVHSWYVSATAPCATTDTAAEQELCGAVALYWFPFAGGAALPRNVPSESLSNSASRAFTTKP